MIVRDSIILATLLPSYKPHEKHAGTQMNDGSRQLPPIDSLVHIAQLSIRNLIKLCNSPIKAYFLEVLCIFHET